MSAISERYSNEKQPCHPVNIWRRMTGHGEDNTVIGSLYRRCRCVRHPSYRKDLLYLGFVFLLNIVYKNWCNAEAAKLPRCFIYRYPETCKIEGICSVHRRKSGAPVVMKLHIGAHQNKQKILKLHFFYGIILSCVDLLPLSVKRKEISWWAKTWAAKNAAKASLKHTYATRAIESGMQPKVLQKLPGHKSIKTTMDRYVHVTDDSMTNAIRQFEAARACA